jgi:phage pi2 protein 07
MSNSTTWYRQPDIFKIIYSDTVSIPDVEAANKVLFEELEKTDADKIHLFCDVSDVKKVDFSIGQLMSNPVLGRNVQHSKLGYVLYYDDKNAFNNFISKVLGSQNANAVRILSSEEKALEFVEKSDS